MKKAFIIHGAYGYPEENWFPWLKNELEKIGYKVFVPQFPTPKGQNLQNWMDIINSHMHDIDEQTIIVAHSLGPLFTLNVLEKINKKVEACFFVAPFLTRLKISKFDELNKTFVEKDYDFMKVRDNCKNFFIYASDNDPYVPLGLSKEFSNKLKVTPKIIPNSGHLNAKSGYTKFEILLEDIKRLKH